MPKADKKNPKDEPGYLVITPIDQLMDDGIQFDGEDEKERVINQMDFSRIREVLQRFAAQLTPDQNDTLIRYLKLCVKPETLT
jgi:hypothetical protein